MRLSLSESEYSKVPIIHSCLVCHPQAHPAIGPLVPTYGWSYSAILRVVRRTFTRHYALRCSCVALRLRCCFVCSGREFGVTMVLDSLPE